MTHTPTPWQISSNLVGDNKDDLVIVHIDQVKDVTGTTYPFEHGIAVIPAGKQGGRFRADAEHIVTCANAHDKLLEALEDMIDHASCRCGGFEGGEFVAQPCDICQAGKDAITLAHKE